MVKFLRLTQYGFFSADRLIDFHPSSFFFFFFLCIFLSLDFHVNFNSLNNVLAFLFQIWIYGNSFESFLVAVVNPNQQALEHWAEQNGQTGDFAALCDNPKAKDYILGELNKTAKAKKVPII